MWFSLFDFVLRNEVKGRPFPEAGCGLFSLNVVICNVGITPSGDYDSQQAPIKLRQSAATLAHTCHFCKRSHTWLVLNTAARLGSKSIWVMDLKILTAAKNNDVPGCRGRQEGISARCTCWLAQLQHTYTAALSLCKFVYSLRSEEPVQQANIDSLPYLFFESVDTASFQLRPSTPKLSKRGSAPGRDHVFLRVGPVPQR